MTLLKIIIKVTHFKTKPAVGYLLFSFSFIIVRRNGGIRNGQISFEFANRVLCFTFSGIEFHNMVVDGMKDFLGNVDFMGWNYSFKRFVSVVWISS